MMQLSDISDTGSLTALGIEKRVSVKSDLGLDPSFCLLPTLQTGTIM